MITDIITTKRAQLTERGLLPRMRQTALPSQITSARPSMRTVRQAAKFLEQSPSVLSKPFSILFDLTLPAIQPALIEKGESHFNAVLDLLCAHGERMLEEHGVSANDHLKTLFTDLPFHIERLKADGGAEAVIGAYSDLAFKHEYKGYQLLSLSALPITYETESGRIVSVKMERPTTDADLSRFSKILLINELQSLDISICYDVTDAGFAKLRHLIGLRELISGGPCKVTEKGFATVGSLQNLEKLCISGMSSLAENGLSVLKRIPRLKDLDISSCFFGDTVIEHLKPLLALRVLAMNHLQVSDSFIPGLGQMPGLRDIKLSSCWNLTDGAVTHLLGLQRIRSLDLGRCDGISDTGLSQLSSMTELEHLFLDKSHVTDVVLDSLRALTGLKTLSLAESEQVTDAGLSLLECFPDLENLNLFRCEKLTDAALAHLTGCTKLRELELGHDKITGAGLAHLKKLAGLKKIALNYCPGIHDRDLAHLKDLPGLECVGLYKTFNITDKGLAHLLDIPNLKRLDLRERVFITDAGIARLQKELPDCEILI